MNKSLVAVIIGFLLTVALVVAGEMLDCVRIQREIGKETYEWQIPNGYTETQSEIFFFWSPEGRNIGKIHEDYWKRKKDRAEKYHNKKFPCVDVLIKNISHFTRFQIVFF